MSHKSETGGAAIRRRRGKVNKDDLLFYIGFMIFPIAQFCVFYLGVNFNSLLLTFQDIDVISNTTTWTLFGNLKEAFTRLTHNSELVTAFGQSLLAYFVPLIIGTPLALLFSYYIYKKMPMSKLFRVMLFMPSIISAIIMVVIFRFFAENAVPEFIKLLTHGEKAQGLIENPNTRFGTIMFYNIWIGFGVNCLMYVNAMNDIPPRARGSRQPRRRNGIQRVLASQFAERVFHACHVFGGRRSRNFYQSVQFIQLLRRKLAGRRYDLRILAVP